MLRKGTIISATYKTDLPLITLTYTLFFLGTLNNNNHPRVIKNTWTVKNEKKLKKHNKDLKEEKYDKPQANQQKQKRR